MQRELAGPFLELLRAERSQLVKEAVGAICNIAPHLGRDLTPFAIALFKDLLSATGGGKSITSGNAVKLELNSSVWTE